MSLAGNAEAPTATAQLKVAARAIQARAARGPIQRQEKKKIYVPYQIDVKQPMTQEEFRAAAMRQIFGRVLKNLVWQNSKDSYVPKNSPYRVQVDIQLLKQRRGQASKDRGISLDKGRRRYRRGGTRQDVLHRVGIRREIRVLCLVKLNPFWCISLAAIASTIGWPCPRPTAVCAS